MVNPLPLWASGVGFIPQGGWADTEGSLSQNLPSSFSVYPVLSLQLMLSIHIYFAECIIFIREIIMSNVKRMLSPCNIEYNSCETQSLEVVLRGPTSKSLYMAMLLQHKMKSSITSRIGSHQPAPYSVSAHPDPEWLPLWAPCICFPPSP